MAADIPMRRPILLLRQNEDLDIVRVEQPPGRNKKLLDSALELRHCSSWRWKRRNLLLQRGSLPLRKAAISKQQRRQRDRRKRDQHAERTPKQAP
jgi:hypothetical protein